MVTQDRIERFLKVIRRYGITLHTVEIAEGGRTVFEKAWAPFSLDQPHRMYSVTKSFVSAAIGCLIDEGKLRLDDRITDFFPDKLPGTVHPWLAEQTIRDMLMMSTCFCGSNWFLPGLTDRCAFYFSQTPCRPAGTLFDYDSTGSYILGVLAERVSGKPLLAYLKEKILNELGGFEDAVILETPDGTPWGDSALVCRPRAMARFAMFMMRGGEWNGKQLLSREYVRAATSRATDTNLSGTYSSDHFGYGYQIWRTEGNGFAFIGMGGQYAICVPDRDFLFVCTGDNQQDPHASNVIFRAVFEELVDPGYTDRLPAEEESILPSANGRADSAFADEIGGKEFVCEPNPMGITRFTLAFGADGGEFRYTNAQGNKVLPFGLGKNVFSEFPELGYSDGRGNVHEMNGFRYRCAAGAGWIEDKKLQIRVQIIDRYFGGLTITIGFRDSKTAGIRMVKTAEDFLDTYSGWAGASRADAIGG